MAARVAELPRQFFRYGSRQRANLTEQSSFQCKSRSLSFNVLPRGYLKRHRHTGRIVENDLIFARGKTQALERSISYVVRKDDVIPQDATSKSVRHVETVSNPVEPHEEEMNSSPGHVPVLTNEVLEYLQPTDGETYIDFTFGVGGHTRALLERAPNARIIAADRDPEAYARAVQLAKDIPNIVPVQGRFSEVLKALPSLGVPQGSLHGALLDVGVCSTQLDVGSRGFSFRRDGPLDMRMDGQRVAGSIAASDVVNTLPEGDLYTIIKRYGEERHARFIARAIVDARQAFGDITGTRQLADIVESVYVGSLARDSDFRKSHVATRTFQALRIFVNDELNELHTALTSLPFLLRPGARCVVISFHSLEDRLVKRHFRGVDGEGSEIWGEGRGPERRLRDPGLLHGSEDVKVACAKTWKLLTKKVVTPSEVEVNSNSRASSAKLRAAVFEGFR